VLGFQAEAGNLCVRNYSKSYHPDYKNLDGATYESEIGAGKTTCFACAVGCRKKVKVEMPYKVTDRLGGPEFETLGCLGSNLEIMDPIAISKANERCNNYGIDTITMGGLAAYLFESVDKYTTGWDCSLWEMMKVGERRINMLRVINARRGFSNKDDVLPKRLNKPLPDGPAQGKCVDPEDFKRMTKQYYALMGWDSQSGNPSEGKLMELGLEWSI
jgi:aldehyde:ferredoxin oxidoreductase